MEVASNQPQNEKQNHVRTKKSRKKASKEVKELSNRDKNENCLEIGLDLFDWLCWFDLNKVLSAYK
jgi:hypothetical protein